MAESLANQPQAAAPNLAAAYRAASDPPTRAHLAEVLARMLIFTNPPQDAVDVARGAGADLPSGMQDERDALTAIDLYAVSFGAVDDGVALEAAYGPSATAGRPAGPGGRMLAAVRAWDAALTGGSAASSVTEAHTALGGGALVRDDPSFMVNIAAGVLVLADRDEALGVWDAALAEGHTHGSMLTLTGVRLWQGWAWLQRGDLVEAEQSLRWYLEATVDRAGEGEVGLGYGLGFLARTLVERGDIGAARRLGVHVGVRSPGSDGDLQYRRAMVELLLTEGRWAEALEAVDALPLRRRPVVNPAWAPFDALATRALCALGPPDEARVRAERGVAAARQWGSPSALGPSLRALGLALGAQRPARSSGSTDDAVDVFREAVASTDGSLARLEHAKSTLALGSALRRRRAPSDARPVLELAVDLATGCGAVPLADLAVAELLASGGRRRARGGLGIEALTPSERRVADLAATGMTNKAIAQELFITPKTVEIHLSHTYRKLGVSSRGELARLGL